MHGPPPFLLLLLEAFLVVGDAAAPRRDGVLLGRPLV